jgi:hypothetical protein
MTEQLDNESHAEAMEAVAQGLAALVSDETLPGGRFQLTAMVQGGALVLSEWRQDQSGEWYSTKCMFIQEGKLPVLADLLRRSGYTVSAAPTS